MLPQRYAHALTQGCLAPYGIGQRLHNRAAAVRIDTRAGQCLLLPGSQIPRRTPCHCVHSPTNGNGSSGNGNGSQRSIDRSTDQHTGTQLQSTVDDALRSGLDSFGSMDDGAGVSDRISVWEKLEEGAAEIGRYRQTSSATPPTAVRPPPSSSFSWKDFSGRIMYKYFNWRQDTVSDLQLFMGLNLAILVLGGAIKRFIDSDSGAGFADFWTDLYNVITISFGQEFPDAQGSTFPTQVFSVAVAVFGLSAFALVLALVEQVVLELLEANVKRGSSVYETGHILILAWGSSQKDLEQIMKILHQICCAYRNDGGTTVVVLTQREKLEMEQAGRKYLPMDLRHGTQFVFRQGSPLIPQDLQLVSAASASATIIVSDHSRAGEEADAQSIRCAVLLDEMLTRRTLPPRPSVSSIGPLGSDAAAAGADVPASMSPPGSIVVVELKTTPAMPLLRLSCSPRVVALPTASLNARRLSHMAKHPIQSVVSQAILNFVSPFTLYVEPQPSLTGLTVAEAAFRLDTALVMGLVDAANGEVALNPPPGLVIQPGIELMIIRPTNVKASKLVPLPKPVEEFFGGVGQLRTAANFRSLADSLWDGSSGGGEGSKNLSTALAEQAREDYIVPIEYVKVDDKPVRLLVCGWGEPSFMAVLIREFDSGSCRLPADSEVILCNDHLKKDTLSRTLRKIRVQHIRVQHVKADPLDISALRRHVDLSRVDCAVVLCDVRWMDPDENDWNGMDMMDLPAFLRLDSLAMMVQLNLHQLLKEKGLPTMSIFGQKTATQGLTRYEDRSRLPLGIGLNFTSYAAKLLACVAYNPKILLPFAQLSDTCELTFVDSSEYAIVGEKLNFWQLMRRGQARREVVLGYYVIPGKGETALLTVLNPSGDERRQPVVWNRGDNRMKIIVYRNKPTAAGMETTQYFAHGTMADQEVATTGPQDQGPSGVTNLKPANGEPAIAVPAASSAIPLVDQSVDLSAAGVGPP